MIDAIANLEKKVADLELRLKELDQIITIREDMVSIHCFNKSTEIILYDSGDIALITASGANFKLVSKIQ